MIHMWTMLRLCLWVATAISLTAITAALAVLVVYLLSLAAL